MVILNIMLKIASSKNLKFFFENKIKESKNPGRNNKSIKDKIVSII